jgi:dihydroorotate dehydrogenase
MYRLARPLLYRFDAEETHDRVMAALGRASTTPPMLRVLERFHQFDDPRLHVCLFGHGLHSPLAVAAGLDKNGVAFPALDAFGFAFVEVGTVTPLPQAGNARPRIFRLPEDRALINRMGFPGAGMAAVGANLMRRPAGTPFALNVGPNKDQVGDAATDVLSVISRLAPFGPLYIVVNVSSPNTARLRELQGKVALQRLLSDVVTESPDVARRIPLLVKIAPDLSDAELDDVLQVVADLRLSGIVATNTTVARTGGLRGVARNQQGGLSGEPLRERSTRMIARIREQSGPDLTIIGAGGVFSGADVLDKIGAGATVVQTYSGMIYEGPGIAKRTKREIIDFMEHEGIASLEQIRGTGFRVPRER